MSRSLAELIAIATELKGVYAEYQKDAADGRISIDEAVSLTGHVLTVLDKHHVTIAELQELLVGIGPLLALVK